MPKPKGDREIGNANFKEVTKGWSEEKTEKFRRALEDEKERRGYDAANTHLTFQELKQAAKDFSAGRGITIPDEAAARKKKPS